LRRRDYLPLTPPFKGGEPPLLASSPPLSHETIISYSSPPLLERLLFLIPLLFEEGLGGRWILPRSSIFQSTDDTEIGAVIS